MGDSEKKSVTIRLDEPDLIEWAASQSAAVASIRMAVKICILQYGKDVDLLDAILRAQFGNENSVRQTSDKNQNGFSKKQTLTEQIESDNNQNIVTQQQIEPTSNNQQSYPQQNMNQNMHQPMDNPQMNQGMNPQMQNFMNGQGQPMNQQMQIPNPNMNGQQRQGQGMSSSLQSLL